MTDSSGITGVNRAIARSGVIVGVLSNALFFLAGCLLPFTGGITTIVMPVSVLGWFYALFAGWRGRKTLDAADPARRWADFSFFLGAAGASLVAFTLVMLLGSILMGVIAAAMMPGGLHLHRH